MHNTNMTTVRQGQTSIAGRKCDNDDALAIQVPSDPSVMTTKGVVAVIADGVTSAEGGKRAAQYCTDRFPEEYFACPDGWRVETAGMNILLPLNRELFSRGQHVDQAERGFVCTLSILVLKARTAHILQVGDSRVYRLRAGVLTQLTTDHSVSISRSTCYLSRAMGLDTQIQPDYITADIETGDIFLLSTDGLHDTLSAPTITSTVLRHSEDLQAASEALVQDALEQGSKDNISCLLLGVDSLPDISALGLEQKAADLPFPPPLSPGQKLDGYRVIREISASSRSQVYQVQDVDSGVVLTMKTPSPNYEDDPAYIRRFVMESWIGRRIDSPNVVKVIPPKQSPTGLYYLTEYIDGISIDRWAAEHPDLQVHEVRSVVEQMVVGLRALHRREILHQDLKPDNILIDRNGRVRIVDFGSCRVAGLEEICSPIERDLILGTVDFSAPEYQLHTPSGARSDLFSLGCITYLLLTGKLPYGPKFGKARSPADFARLVYTPAFHHNPSVPLWVDGALQKAVQLKSQERYEVLSHFVEDLRHPNPEFLRHDRKPLIERNPLLFWKACTGILVVVVVILLVRLLGSGT
jgi:serine/threonine protein phosphatase PrpC